MNKRQAHTRRARALTRLCLVLLWAFTIVGCENDKKAAKPDFGPEIPAEEVETALLRPVQAIDPSAIQIGQFVHFAETQTINNQHQAVTSDTGQTVVSRTEEVDHYLYTIVENKFTYSQTDSRKVSRELELRVAKTAAAAESEIENEDEAEREGLVSNGYPITATIENGPSLDLRLHAQRVLSYESTPLKALAAVFAIESKAVRVTYHNLRVGLETVAPPAAVASQPGCGGIPTCKIRLHHISFDQVAWQSETQAEKVAFEFTMSEDVPYLANIMDKCATLLVPITDEKGKTTQVLLRQCSPVLNFRFEAPASQSEDELQP